MGDRHRGDCCEHGEGPVTALRQLEAGRVCQDGLRIGQVHVRQPRQELDSGPLADRAEDQERPCVLRGSHGITHGQQPGDCLPAPRARPAPAGLVGQRRNVDHERRTYLEERPDRSARRQELALCRRAAVEGGGWRKPHGDPAGHGTGFDRPVQVNETIRQRGRKLPAVGRLFGRIGRGNHPDSLGQGQIADDTLEHDPEHGGLYGGRRRRELIEEEEAMPGGGKASCPEGRGHLDGPVDHHRQACEIGRLADGADYHLGRPAQALSESAHH